MSSHSIVVYIWGKRGEIFYTSYNVLPRDGATYKETISMEEAYISFDVGLYIEKS